MTQPTYHPNLPPACPPNEVHPAAGDVYRGIRNIPISDNDFLSYAELGQINCDPTDCEHWGLSVWTNIAAVEHARRLNKWMRRWHIAKGTIQNSDGAMLPTPSRYNPGHTTFWKAHDVVITARFKIVMQPIS